LIWTKVSAPDSASSALARYFGFDRIRFCVAFCTPMPRMSMPVWPASRFWSTVVALTSSVIMSILLACRTCRWDGSVDSLKYGFGTSTMPGSELDCEKDCTSYSPVNESFETWLE
jgi:hypothetical protein